jgi:hypothetical protein
MNDGVLVGPGPNGLVMADVLHADRDGHPWSLVGLALHADLLPESRTGTVADWLHHRLGHRVGFPSPDGAARGDRVTPGGSREEAPAR